MKCDKLKSLWVYCRDINENVDDEFLKFAPKNGYEELVEKSEVDEAIAELKQKLDEYVLVKLSTQQMLQNLLDCGLIKEWYFNGKFNVVLKADDPHLQIKELKAKLENVQASMYCDVVDANMEVRRLKESVKGLILDNYLKDKETRHNKYKRCLAMAKWCEFYADSLRVKRNQCRYDETELAEKFKEAK